MWSKETQGLLLGAVYWGYMSTQVFASYLYFLFGARRVCVVSMLTMSVLTMLCHPAAHWSPWAVFTVRVAMGVCTVSGAVGVLGWWMVCVVSMLAMSVLAMSVLAMSVLAMSVLTMSVLAMSVLAMLCHPVVCWYLSEWPWVCLR